MSGIRVTYTGLVSFVFRLAIIFANMVFLLIITRTLAVEEYGTWGLISSMLIYVVLAEVIIGYWVSREIARKNESANTGIITSGLLSGGGVAAYIIFALIVGSQADIDLGVMFFAAVLIPFRYISGTLIKINLSWKPHTTSYALFTQSLLHIPLSLFFIYHMEWGITGVILSVVLAQAVFNMMLVAYVREKIRSEFDFAYVRKWFRLSWVSLYPSFAAIIFRLDVIVFTLITGSVAVVALWTVSFTVAFIITHSSLIATALYPKLLEGDGIKYIQKNLTLFFYFSIPLTAIIIALAKPILFVLNPAYQEAHIAMSLLSIGMFFTAMTVIFQMILEGNEKIDTFEKASVRDFMQSKLFIVPTINVVQYGAYIVALVVVFLVLLPVVSEAELLILWACLATITRIPAVVYQYRLIRRDIGLKVEISNVIKYMGASIGVFGVMFIIQQEHLADATIFVFLPNLIGYAVAGMAGYFAITYAIDSKTRILVDGIIQEIKKKRKK